MTTLTSARDVLTAQEIVNTYNGYTPAGWHNDGDDRKEAIHRLYALGMRNRAWNGKYPVEVIAAINEIKAAQ